MGRSAITLGGGAGIFGSWLVGGLFLDGYRSNVVGGILTDCTYLSSRYAMDCGLLASPGTRGTTLVDTSME